MKPNQCMKGFLPSGKDAFIAAALFGFICACGLHTYDRVIKKIEDEPPPLFARQTANQFQTGNACIPEKHILSGGVRKDAIPSLTNPKMIPAKTASYLEEDDRVIGIEVQKQAMAYPLRILAWHECVNETAGDYHFAVIYCPLCDSTSVFNRELSNQILEFGISGKLYQSNVLLYDRQDDPNQESLWSQMYGKAISGPLVDTELETFPHHVVTWAEWKTTHPNTKVLSDNTGHVREYKKLFYSNYFDSPKLMFPVYQDDSRLLLKDLVIGLRHQDQAKAYPIGKINFSEQSIIDTFAGKTVTLKKSKRGDVIIDAEEGIDVYHSFWFAWYAFHPHTDVFSNH